MVLLNCKRKEARLEDLAEYNPTAAYLQSRRRLKHPDTADQVIWGIVGGIAVLAMVALVRLF